MASSEFRGIKFTDADVMTYPEDWIPRGEYNPHNVRPWLLHDHGIVLCVVFASNMQDALDTAVDADKLDRFQVAEADLKDYQTGTDSEGNPECEGIDYLGNAGEPFDIESLGIEELPIPAASFCAQFNAFQDSTPENDR